MKRITSKMKLNLDLKKDIKSVAMIKNQIDKVILLVI